MNCQNCQNNDFVEKTSKGFLIKVCKNCKLCQFYRIGHNGVKAKIAGADPKLWAEFLEFWNLYPNHKGGSMQVIFERYKANPADLQKLKIILPLQIADKNRKGFEMPMPATYLNQRRWEENPKEYGYDEQKERDNLRKKFNNQFREVKQDLQYNNISKEKANELIAKIREEAEKHGFKFKEQ